MLRNAYIGEEKVARIYTGDKIVHPSPVMDGLVLWYDFMGRKNSDAQRAVAEDLSGNGNDGALTNFAYQAGSGYEDGGLRFDGVDDLVYLGIKTEYVEKISYSFLFELNSYREIGSYQCLLYWNSPTYMMIRNASKTLFFSFSTDGERPRVTRDTGFKVEVGKTYYFTVTYDGISVKVYNNDLLIDNFAMSGRVSVNSVATIGRYSSGLGFFAGEAFSASLYKKALSDEEVTRNYQMEKERWNL